MDWSLVMAMNRILAALGAWLLVAATPPAPFDIPPPPPEVAAQLDADHVPTDDLAWLRGAFPGASREQVALHRAIEDWAARCRASADAAERRDLASLGVTVSGEARLGAGSALCGRLSPGAGLERDYANWSALSPASARVRPLLRAFLAGVNLAEDSSYAAYGDRMISPSQGMLLRRPLREQAYRKAMQFSAWDGTGLALADWPLLQALLGARLARVDQANSDWLKREVADQGWPGIARVGATASGNAWLLVQHADHDPLFQYNALRLMEPMLASGDVSRSNYAYLYDRVMLKLTGKQRYGTQFTCVNGKRDTRPLDGSGSVDTLRKGMDLDSLSAYRATMIKRFGETC